MSAFLLSTVVIFLAELGDKSQLMAMTFATRFRARDVLIGITAATAIVHLLSVALGAAVGAALPTTAISVVGGLAFLGFAGWTLRGDRLDEDEQTKAARATSAAILAVGGAFFLAELGDKTMLATVTLATREDWLGTWIGSTVGHGGRRRAGDRGRRGAGTAAAREDDPVRRCRRLRRLRPAPARLRPPALTDRPPALIMREPHRSAARSLGAAGLPARDPAQSVLPVPRWVHEEGGRGPGTVKWATTRADASGEAPVRSEMFDRLTYAVLREDPRAPPLAPPPHRSDRRTRCSVARPQPGRLRRHRRREHRRGRHVGEHRRAGPDRGHDDPATPAHRRPRRGRSLPDRAAALGAAFSDGDYGVVWDIACPGRAQGRQPRGLHRHDGRGPRGWAEPTRRSSTARSRRDPGRARRPRRRPRRPTRWSASTSPRAAPNPNPTMTAWFVTPTPAGSTAAWSPTPEAGPVTVAAKRA